MTIYLENLPPQITGSTRAVLWRPEVRDGKPTKVPYQARRPDAMARVDDPTTWAPFPFAYDVCLARSEFGVGIVLDGTDRLVGVDLDKCRHPETGVIEPWAQTIIERLDSYSEASPSGTGVRVFVVGTLPPGGRKRGRVEIYADKRYLTVTGHRIPDTPGTINDRTIAIAAVHRDVFGVPADNPAPPRSASPVVDLDDATLLGKAGAATNGATFARLWAGDVSAYAGDESAADLALCNLLAFWTGRDDDQIDRLFRQSGLMREKWDSRRRDSTYGADTIAKAIAGCRDVYEPPVEIELDTDPVPTRSDPTTELGTAWPHLADEALVGTLGTIVRAMGPITEADRVGLLAHLLMGVGSLIGRSPHVLVGATSHHANENALVIGDTSVGRKGTAWDESLALLADVDLDWAATRVLGGLSSGEGLIAEVRDASADGEDPGILDKRLLVVETEFGKVLRVCRREGNTVSTVLRQAWDSGTLRTMTRGQPLRATGTHISIIGHCTPRELRQELKAVDMASGFANRFLLVLVRRSQLLPDGGRLPDRDRQELLTLLERAVTLARRCTEIARTDDARDHWRLIYPDLTGARDGLVGALCNRAAAHVIRLSLIYALADGSPVITLAHQQAAHALWQFSEASIQYVFGHRVGDRLADFLLAVIRDAGAEGVTQTEISAACGRHQTADRIHEALQTLVDYGVIASTQLPGKGRAPTRWYASEYAKKAK